MAGDSGVGKTTLARVFSMILGVENCTILHGDDLHKYPRNHEMWDKLTHLNPEANHLDLGDKHLRDLYDLKPIERSAYNHKTGLFDDPVKINPTKYIIDDGLHSLYTETNKELSSIKIYVDSPYELICHWKINRDTRERGQSLGQVVDSMEKRRPDSDKYIKPQKDNCDIIIRFKLLSPIKNIGDSNESINLDIEYVSINEFKFKGLFDHLFANLREYTRKINEFAVYSRKIGRDKTLVQGPGGNLSIKLNGDLMLIKSSGVQLKDVYHASGFSALSYNYIHDFYAASNGEIGDEDMNEVLAEATLKGDDRASMEAAAHAILSGDVVHTHPVYVNSILCSLNSREACAEAFDGFDYEYIPSAMPGAELTGKLLKSSSDKEIFFLENHGLIVRYGSLKECVSLTEEINEAARDYLKKKIPNFVKFEDFNGAKKEIAEGYLYPDDIMFLHATDKPYRDDVVAAHNYIVEFAGALGGVRFLDDEVVSKITQMESEKYRSKM